MSKGGRTGKDDSLAKRYARLFAVWFVASVAVGVLTKSLWLPLYFAWMMIATEVGKRVLPEPRGERLASLIAASLAIAVTLGWRLAS